MSKFWWFVLGLLVVLVVLSAIFSNLALGAGIGAFILVGALIYVTLKQKTEGDADVARAERGARELREELDARDNP